MTDRDKAVLKEGLRQIHAGAQHMNNNVGIGVDLSDVWMHMAQAVVLIKRMLRDEGLAEPPAKARSSPA